MLHVLKKVRHGLRKPPGYILRRIVVEAKAEAERYLGPRRSRHFDLAALLSATRSDSLSSLWKQLQERSYLATKVTTRQEYEQICTGDVDRIVVEAEAGLNHSVDLLGSGPLKLGQEIDWHKDYKTNLSWPREYCRSIDYMNPERPSDVKFPWEVSRMQWLIPAGQAYLLTGEERYASGVRDVIEQWIRSNPYSYGVNWGCTMEVALRVLTWTWFFHAFAGSASWSDPQFQQSFLKSLYMHASFTERHLEKSDINGNHYTADAAGLVFAGLFFRQGDDAERWLNLGWQILCDEFPRQVFADGVDFEASVPYHRLVLELFLLPALYRQASGLKVPDFYRERLGKMGEFTAAYSRTDGSIPLWGDADDARALPFGPQPINDHRYLLGLLGCSVAPELKKFFKGPRPEIFWLLGREAAESLGDRSMPEEQPDSARFEEGGFYIMRSDRDHVFIDCGPVGLGGRGGHGHNDILSFEAVLDGVRLVSDCGAYVYTADYAARNRFRATAAHNTPMIDGEEINRFIAPDHLWSFRNDARPQLRRWETSAERDLFCGAHSGYQRLSSPVTPVRTIELDKQTHTLTVVDEFEGRPQGKVEIPLHLAAGVEILSWMPEGRVVLRAQQREFELIWQDPKAWQMSIQDANVSPSYGIAVKASRLLWCQTDAKSSPFRMVLRLSGGA